MKERILLSTDAENIDDYTFEEPDEFFTSFVKKYEDRYHSRIVGALFTGKFISRYDAIFSGRGGFFIPNRDFTALEILSRFEFDAVKIYIDSTGHVNFELTNHDGVFTFVLTLINESFSSRKHFETLLFDNDGRITAELVKTLFGKIDLFGTKVFKFAA
jgi:hypothetical protein